MSPLIRNISPVAQAVEGRGAARPGETLEVSEAQAASLTRSPAWEPAGSPAAPEDNHGPEAAPEEEE